MPLALRRQGQAGLHEAEVHLVYIVRPCLKVYKDHAHT